MQSFGRSGSGSIALKKGDDAAVMGGKKAYDKNMWKAREGSFERRAGWLGCPIREKGKSLKRGGIGKKGTLRGGRYTTSNLLDPSRKKRRNEAGGGDGSTGKEGSSLVEKEERQRGEKLAELKLTHAITWKKIMSRLAARRKWRRSWSNKRRGDRCLTAGGLRGKKKPNLGGGKGSWGQRLGREGKSDPAPYKGPSASRSSRGHRYREDRRPCQAGQKKAVEPKRKRSPPSGKTAQFIQCLARRAREKRGKGDIRVFPRR